MTPPTTGHNRALSLRLSDTQWNHLVVQAQLDGVTLSEVVRRSIERDIDASPDLGHGDDASPGIAMRYRSLLAVGDFDQALDELREAGRAS